MEQEPFFIINDFLEKERIELENILQVIQKKDIKENDRAVFLRDFTNELFKANRKLKRNIKEIKAADFDTQKQDLEKRKLELLKKLGEMQKIPQKSILVEEKTIISSKETKKPLVKTEFDEKTYKIIEPELLDDDKEILNNIKKYKIEDMKNRLKELCKNLNVDFSEEYYDKIRYFYIRDLKKYGKISALIEDKDVKEIICKGADKPILVYYKDKQEIPTNIIFESDEEINNLIKNIAVKTKQNVSKEKPFISVGINNMHLSANISTDFIKPKFIIIKN